MGIYLNPSNENFQEAVDSEIYVDKTGLIAFTNKRIKTSQKHICVSRPRRFGKSTNLAMLAAYYSKGCDSRELFAGLSIASSESYSKHLNQYNVIYINMQEFLSGSKSIDDMLMMLKSFILKEFKKVYADIEWNASINLSFSFDEFYDESHVPFVILIDEWDCVMREHMNDKESQKVYLDFLRNWLKDKAYVALAYMTGILPIKKFGTQSGLNMFDEYSLLSSGAIGKYVDFTADEVSELCQKYEVDFEQMKTWYGGYYLNGTELYCPDSVVKAVSSKKFGGYWTEKETYEVLEQYISMNFDGLLDTIEKLLAGQPQPVFTKTFSNDMVTFANKDNVLTLLVHLGYLGYNADDRTVYIPNKEIADEFVVSMKATGLWKETIAAVLQSRQLLADTLQGKADIVAEAIEKIHDSNSSVINYNNEQSLRFIILIAYYYAKEKYEIIQEMPSGKGFADIMFIPKRNVDMAAYPPMVIELKWNQSADTAIRLIRDRNYPERLKGYEKILLVGINYDKDSKKHDCVIEEYKTN